MAPKRKSSGSVNRDLGFGINHGSNGKGSKTRVTNPAQYAANFSEINWGPKVDENSARVCRDHGYPATFMPIIYIRKKA